MRIFKFNKNVLNIIISRLKQIEIKIDKILYNNINKNKVSNINNNIKLKIKIVKNMITIIKINIIYELIYE